MPSDHSKGPWGKPPAGNQNPKPNTTGRPPTNPNWGSNKRPSNKQPPPIPGLEDLLKQGQEQLKTIMGAGGGNNGRNGKNKPPLSGGALMVPKINGRNFIIALLVLLAIWLSLSLYRVDTSEKSVELFLGQFSSIGEEGLNFAPWPLVTHEVIKVTTERTEQIGVGRSNSADAGLMLTTDENVVDIDFQVVWNINDPAKFLFNLRDPENTIRAVSESAMREIIAQSELAPIRNRNRDSIALELETLVQSVLDSYNAGVNIVRINFDKADPPSEVIDAFREVQAAEQERDRLQRQADAYANRVLAGARGEAAQLVEQAEAYRAEAINLAEGEASRFLAVLEEYQKARDVTRRRLYIETIESILANIDKIVIDSNNTENSNVLSYLPLNELLRSTKPKEGTNQ